MAITAQDYHMTDVWQDVGGREYFNVYYVRHTAGTQTAQDVASCFATYMMPRIAAILHTTMSHVRTTIYSLTDPSDYGEISTALAGLAAGDALPSFVSAGYSIVRSSRDFRNSGKRFGRLSETDVTANSITASSQARFAAVQDGLLDTWVDGGVNVQLMIPRRTKVVDKYVLADLQRPSAIGQATVTSQNSRK